MALATYDPFAFMNQLQKEVNRLFDSRIDDGRSEHGAAVTSDWMPLVDVQEEHERYVIYADIPGVELQDIDITMENAVLVIRGKRVEQAGSAANGYKRRERPGGLFYRRFVMPDTADAEGITAQVKQGVLQIVIPKRQKALARRIEVAG
ncbi:MAG: Hsp20/alpha crystallin family protein [Pseudomonadota bacterium]